MTMFRPRRHSILRQPKLIFAPLAYLKLQYFCHAGDTEVGGFAITASKRPLYVQEFVTLAQDTNPIAVKFHDDAVADYFDQCVDRGLAPEQFARIWLHTHPGDSVIPSLTDEQTFDRVFGHCHWAVMAILGRTGRTSARLAVHSGIRLDLEIGVRVDWAAWPDALAQEAAYFDWLLDEWQKEYHANIHPMPRIGGMDQPLLLDPFAAVVCPSVGDGDELLDRSISSGGLDEPVI
ncbi:MAG: hypothetical protein ACJ8C4_15240 [Gemmataceae bacterium]